MFCIAAKTFFLKKRKRNALILNPLIGVCVSRKFTVALTGVLLKLSHPLKRSNPYVLTRVSRSSLACISSPHLWRRSCWFSEDSVLLACFFSPMSLLTTFSCFRAELKPSLALLFCLTVKSCSALFTLLLKTEMTLAPVRFWCFFVHSIHSGPFRFKTMQLNVLLKSSIPENVLTSETTLCLCARSGLSRGFIHSLKSRWRPD